MKYKLFFLSVSMLFLISESKSQTSETKCLHYPYNTQVGLNLNANLLNKMRVEPQSDYFRSHPSFGAGLGVYMYQRVYKWFGIQIGAECSAISTCYSEIGAFSDYNMNGKRMAVTGAFTFPILFNASYYFNEKHGLDISLGTAPLLRFPGNLGMGMGYGDYAGYSFSLDNDVSLNIINLYTKIGYNFLFKNKNTFGVAIIGSYTSQPYTKGYYSVLANDRMMESGRVSLRNTFIGIQFSYGFSMKKLLCVPRSE